jgi:hypothetical protein
MSAPFLQFFDQIQRRTAAASKASAAEASDDPAGPLVEAQAEAVTLPESHDDALGGIPPADEQGAAGEYPIPSNR